MRPGPPIGQGPIIPPARPACTCGLRPAPGPDSLEVVDTRPARGPQPEIIMNGAFSLLLSLAPILAGGAPEPDPAPAEFRRWFAEASAGTLRIPDSVEREARRFRYVFVGGFCNERMP